MSKGNLANNYIYGPHLNVGTMGSNTVVNEVLLNTRMYRRVMTELACNRFKWEGLPEEVDSRYLEVTLFRNALAVFFQMEHELYGEKYFCLNGTGAGRIDPYDNPMQFIVNGNNLLNLTIARKNCVPIWANYLREPDWDVVAVFSNRLAQLDRTISIAQMNMRNTNFVFATENEQLSMQNIMRQRDEGQMTVHVVKQGFDPATQIAAIDMKQHPDTLPKLMVAHSKTWNQCMTLLGINNANQDKAERLVADEVAANDAQVESFQRVALNAREQACEAINKKYKLNVSVEFHETEAEPLTPGMGGLHNGNVHNEIASSDGTDG